ncbi:MAG: trypsin-like peptidase domain-containing protein [Anaerolineae bacterium]|jgi:hypothetical protein
MKKRNTRWFAALLSLGLLLVLAAPYTSADQGGQSSLPEGLAQGGGSLDTVAVMTMPPVDVEALEAEDEARARNGLPPRFAYPMKVEITPQNAGTWEALAGGGQLWRLRIASPGAVTLNLGFTRYAMPPGGKLYVYGADYGTVLGPFTAKDNETHGELWTPVVAGDEIVVEVQIPADQLADIELLLTSVNHGYTGFGTPGGLLSGSCNLDVVCSAADGFPQVDAWRDQIRSVGVISTGGSTFCTGFMVNNTAQDLTPFFMTANHCGINSGNAASLVVYWNYENSWCRPPGSPASGGPGDGTLDQWQSGSIWRASYSSSDMTLVQLDDDPDPVWNVYWAGWDRTPADATSAVAIHHPNTDEKRISFEDDPTTTTSYLGTAVPGDGTHVRVADWDLGTTEPGSSGSPLFNQDQRIIGQLHGGYAACGNDLSDWYGRFSVSWTGGGSPSSRLSDWLDPLNTGVPYLDGRGLNTTPYGLEVQPLSQEVCAPAEATYAVTVTQLMADFTDPVTLSVQGVPGGASPIFGSNPVIPTATTSLIITGTGSATAGNYDLDVLAETASHSISATVGLDLYDGAAAQPTLATPGDGATGQSLTPNFTWSEEPSASRYSFQLAADPLFSTPLLWESDLVGPAYAPPAALEGGRCYWWRAQGENACGSGSWADAFRFATIQWATRFEDDIESGDALWSHQANQGTDHWAISTAQAHSPDNAWHVPDDPQRTDSSLWNSTAVVLESGSVLNFWHRYEFEGNGWDGAVLEISTDGGASWADLGPQITANGYNGTINSSFSNPLGGRAGWIGDLTTWTQVSVDLSGYAGQGVQVRWRIGCDVMAGDTGWYIDDVEIVAPVPSQGAPVLLNVIPNWGRPHEETAIQIQGSNFVGMPVIMLGDTWLLPVTQTSPTTLGAIVPAGLPLGTYDLAIYNGDCQTANLVDAFSVAQESTDHYFYLPLVWKASTP